MVGQVAKLSVLSLHRLCFGRLVKLHLLRWDLIVVKLGPRLALTIFLCRMLLRKLVIRAHQNVARRVECLALVESHLFIDVIFASGSLPALHE